MVFNDPLPAGPPGATAGVSAGRTPAPRLRASHPGGAAAGGWAVRRGRAFAVPSLNVQRRRQREQWLECCLAPAVSFWRWRRCQQCIAARLTPTPGPRQDPQQLTALRQLGVARAVQHLLDAPSGLGQLMRGAPALVSTRLASCAAVPAVPAALPNAAPEETPRCSCVLRWLSARGLSKLLLHCPCVGGSGTQLTGLLLTFGSPSLQVQLANEAAALDWPAAAAFSSPSSHLPCRSSWVMRRRSWQTAGWCEYCRYGRSACRYMSAAWPCWVQPPGHCTACGPGTVHKQPTLTLLLIPFACLRAAVCL